MPNIETQTIELDGNSVENPNYCNHKWGRNWAALLRGKNAANMEREFLKSRGSTIDLEPVHVGSVIEVAGDYTSSGGNFQPDRIYWRVLEKTDDEMTVEVYPTPAKALKAANAAMKAATSMEAA